MTRRVADMSSRWVLAVLFAFTLVVCVAAAQTPPAGSAAPQTPPKANAVAADSASAADDTLPIQTFKSRSDEISRSEEHTSELQSQSNLVCRLLLEKKKKKKKKKKKTKKEE